MKLSILICSLENRSDLLSLLTDHLRQQIENDREGVTGNVEILVNTDSGKKSTGRKRQELLEDAQGEYIVYIDDDDWVPHYYVRQMLRGCNSGADCMAINGTITTDGRNEIRWRISKDYENQTIKERGQVIYLRKTNHITAVKRELALLAGFPDISNAEDKSYSIALNPHLKTEFVIVNPMYWYRYVSFNKSYI